MRNSGAILDDLLLIWGASRPACPMPDMHGGQAGQARRPSTPWRLRIL